MSLCFNMHWPVQSESSSKLGMAYRRQNTLRTEKPIPWGVKNKDFMGKGEVIDKNQGEVAEMQEKGEQFHKEVSEMGIQEG